MSSPPAEDSFAARKTPPTISRRPPSPPVSDRDSPSAAPLDQADQRLIQQIDRGIKTAFYLDPDRFERLRPYLPEVRLDYDPEKELLQRHMPDVIHEAMIQVLEDCLRQEIRRLSQSPDVDSRVRDALQKVKPRRSTDIINPRGSRFELRTPDISFRAVSSNSHPSLVCEVAYSQKSKNVQDACIQHIKHSKGAVQCAIAVDLPYNEPKAGTVAVYRAGSKSGGRRSTRRRGTAIVVHHAEFITSDAGSIEGELVLRASDLICLGRNEGRAEADGALLKIPLRTLYDEYYEAQTDKARPQKRKLDDLSELDWSSYPTDSDYSSEAEPPSKSWWTMLLSQGLHEKQARDVAPNA
ncbi:hypothetical protein Tdes44962_MAKER07934 [Teratosphaeria destructans]|uniref:Uncharacterized protein n=1 Tax=Teratosphaeria destructans TaxID=418781 RepID=A0A9W7SXG8_9PEZI|nr:hypothetical protein Tdes44962_MAKER07934 [Teratosphaeria destructans]